MTTTEYSLPPNTMKLLIIALIAICANAKTEGPDERIAFDPTRLAGAFFDSGGIGGVIFKVGD